MSRKTQDALVGLIRTSRSALRVATMPDGPSIGDFKGHARDALHLSATKIWAVKALARCRSRSGRLLNVALAGSTSRSRWKGARIWTPRHTARTSPSSSNRRGCAERACRSRCAARQPRRRDGSDGSDACLVPTSRAIRDALARSCRARQRASSKKERRDAARPRRRAPAPSSLSRRLTHRVPSTCFRAQMGRDLDTWFGADAMSLEELKRRAMAVSVRPLAKGAEKERWRQVEVTPTDADAKSEDSWASEKEEKEDTPMDATPVVEYVGVAAKAAERARDRRHHARATGLRRARGGGEHRRRRGPPSPPRVRAVRGGRAREPPARAGAARGAVVLERRRARRSCAVETKRCARVMTKADVEAAAHGLWEMATDARARGAEDFHDAPEAFDAVVGLMEADESIVGRRRRGGSRHRRGGLESRGFRAGAPAYSPPRGSRARTTATAGAARWSRRLPRCWTRRARRWIGSRPRRLRKPPPREAAARAPAEEEDKRAGESVGGDAPEEAPVARAEPPTAEAASSASVGETNAGGDASSAEPASAEPVSSASSDVVALFEHAVGAVGVLAVDTLVPRRARAPRPVLLRRARQSMRRLERHGGRHGARGDVRRPPRHGGARARLDVDPRSATAASARSNPAGSAAHAVIRSGRRERLRAPRGVGDGRIVRARAPRSLQGQDAGRGRQDVRARDGEVPGGGGPGLGGPGAKIVPRRQGHRARVCASMAGMRARWCAARRARGSAPPRTATRRVRGGDRP